ncbi:MAG: hypothetical protein QW175_06900 [Candidatus Bathyarchaeia archaeon]
MESGMFSEKLKIVALATISLISLFASCLLAYKNHLLENDIMVLRSELEAKASELEMLESRYETLLAVYQKLLGENAVLNESYTALQQNYIALSGNFEKLMAEYVELTAAYTALNETYVMLLQNYTVLQQQAQGYLELQSRYEVLLDNYQELLSNYTVLKAAYSEVCFAVYSPLWSNETVTPTISELKDWLAEDDTDSLPYSRWDFVCGDFAVMLSIRAEMKHWDMGVVAVLGRDAYGNEFNHAFNAIRCVERLVYIEPQNDQVFYGPISEGSWYNHPGFGRIYVETFIIVVPYQPPL